MLNSSRSSTFSKAFKAPPSSFLYSKLSRYVGGGLLLVFDRDSPHTPRKSLVYCHLGEGVHSLANSGAQPRPKRQPTLRPDSSLILPMVRNFPDMSTMSLSAISLAFVCSFRVAQVAPTANSINVTFTSSEEWVLKFQPHRIVEQPLQSPGRVNRMANRRAGRPFLSYLLLPHKGVPEL
jgi:hypothetical protein